MPLFGHDNATNDHDDHERNGSFFSRNRRSSSPSDSGSPNRSKSIMGRFRSGSSDSEAHFAKDPTIKEAKTKVTEAENAEKAADKALDMARSKVRTARQHVKDLENAAREE